MSDFLRLAQQTRSDCAVAGTGPTATEGQTGEYFRIVKYVADADTYIQTDWRDWRFLWDAFEFQTVPGQREYPLNTLMTRDGVALDTVFGHWKRDAFVWDPSGAYQDIAWKDFERFKRANYFGAIAASVPTVITALASNNLVLHPTPESVSTVYGEFFRKPVRMVKHDDVSAIPEQYHRIIVCQATLRYAQFEEATELWQMANSEYMEWLERLEGAELPNGDYRNLSQLDDEQLVVVAQ